ncbi:hypothetical protein SCLCIDRAFT_34211 [Scleroderma citrinum Foug A]|uniref:Uncharacterized protein n=1 Tax=Scleroderma citrinum Foug A TaxID=1036808 RepID=A0A0C2ZBV7_9AGAM|nr:hypothetical protein SCLCIDRAFT_34211 [Scleroderma citrinum Foug A]
MSNLEADLVDIQVGGGGRPDATAPPVLTPTRLRTSIKATDRDGGLISKSLERKQFLREPEIGCASDLFQSTDDALEVDFLQTPSRKNSVSTCSQGSPMPKGKVSEPLWSGGEAPTIPIACVAEILKAKRLPSRKPHAHPTKEVNSMSTPSSKCPNEESNISFVDNPSSMQLEPTLHLDAKLVSDMLRPEVATSTSSYTPSVDAVALPPSEDSPVDLDKSEDNQFTIGRLSDAILDIVQEGLDHITTYLTDLVQYMRLNSANDWNKYSKYFAQNTQAELNRFRKTGAQAGSVDTKLVTVCRQCYELFKKDYPETWQKILTKFEESVQYTEAGKMFAALSKSHSIEAVFIMAESIVNQDASLGYSYTTPGAEDFFMEHCRSDLDAIIGHFKAHIYNRSSLACITDSFDQDKSGIKGKGKECSDVGPDVVDLTLDSGNHTPDHANDEREDHKLVKKLLTSQIESWSHVGLREAVSLEATSTEAGQEHASHSKLKGVSDLTILESAQVIAALRDTGPYRLHFKSMLNKKMDLLGSKIPIIHGAPPLSDSDSLRGKRVFFNGKVDYEGPACLPNTAKTQIRKQVGGGKPPTLKTDPSSDIENLFDMSPSPAPMQLHQEKPIMP